jgi:hypothetical protein
MLFSTAPTPYVIMLEGFGPDEYWLTYDCVGMSSGKLFSEATSTYFPIAATLAAALPASDSDWQNLTASENEIITTAPFFDSMLHSIYPQWPLCTGTMDGFPQPKVVVDALTTTSSNVKQSQSQVTSPQPITLPTSTEPSPTTSSVRTGVITSSPVSSVSTRVGGNTTGTISLFTGDAVSSRIIGRFMFHHWCLLFLTLRVLF